MFQTVIPLSICFEEPNEDLLHRLERAGATQVALAIPREIDHSFSSPKTLATLQRFLEFFTEKGYETMVWLGQTFGHDTASGGGQYTPIQCVGQENSPNSSVFCPLDPHFLEDFKAWMIKIARCGAKLILLDDDFRLSYRGTGVGCCCDRHMEALCRELGETITREELKEKVFLGPKNRYRDAWMKVQKSSMEQFGRELRKAVSSVDASIRLGFCCSPCGFDLDMDTLSLAKIMAGDTKPFLRTLGAPYWATKANRRLLGEIVNMERMEIQWCRDEGIETIAEGDNFPRPRFMTPAAYVEVFESILAADGQNDGILKFCWKSTDAPDYETGYLEAAEEARELNRQIRELFCDKTEAVGLHPYNRPNLTQDADLDEEGLARCEKSLYYPSLNFTAVTSMPGAFQGEGIQVVFGENARKLPRELLKQGCILDAPAAFLLTQRGIDVGILPHAKPTVYGAKGTFGGLREYDEKQRYSTDMLGTVKVYDFPRAERTRTLSYFEFNAQRYPGVYQYENAQGERFLVYPFDADDARYGKHWFNSYWRKNQLIESLEFLGKKPFEAYVVSQAPMLYPLIKKNKDAIAVGLWNIFEDKLKNARIRVEGDYQSIRFVNCQGHREGKDVVLDSVLYPFEFAGFELKK